MLGYQELFIQKRFYSMIRGYGVLIEALGSGMFAVIKICLKWCMQREMGKKQPLNIKTAVERPILKLGLPNFRLSFYF